MPVYVEGLDDLRRSLKEAGIDLKELKGPNRAAANVVKPASEALAPRRSGDLVKTTRIGATQRAGFVRAGRKLVPYAGPIHWGWKARNIKPSLWLTKAAQKTEPEWTRVYLDHVDDVIDLIRGK